MSATDLTYDNTNVTCFSADVRVLTMAEITYVHVMFDDHEVIYSEGAASESFYTGAVAMSTLDQAARREIIELFPEIAQDDCPPPTPARPLLPGRIGRKIAARHGMNSKPLVA